MSYRKYRCVAKCPELDGEGEPHCTCEDPSIAFKDNKCSECGVCPVGNVPVWKKIKYYRYYVVYFVGGFYGSEEFLLEEPLTSISKITEIAESIENSHNLPATPIIINFQLLETDDADKSDEVPVGEIKPGVQFSYKGKIYRKTDKKVPAHHILNFADVKLCSAEGDLDGYTDDFYFDERLLVDLI